MTKNTNKRSKRIKKSLDKAQVQELALVYPHQLFQSNPAVEAADFTLLVEAPRFFEEYEYHKKKLMLHRASIKWYADSLSSPSEVVPCTVLESTEDLFTLLPDGINNIHITEVADEPLRQDLLSEIENMSATFTWHSNPLFILSQEEANQLITDQAPYRLESFYRKVRKENGILMNGDEPAGGQWNFDKQNRESLSDDVELPEPPSVNTNKYLTDARSYVRQHFGDNYGDDDLFYYPVTRKEAREWLDRFISLRFDKFGPYQDAIQKDNHTLFHSMISPALNIGLLSVDEVVDAAIEAYESGDAPLQSVEGFVRQVIGWREFMRVIYQKEGMEMRDGNIFNCEHKLPDAFWSGDTGIPPVDDVISYVNKHGYAHHIERLMILSNFMLLVEVHPDDVYEWFMSMFVDAYDWVMVPNVYDMGQFASGGVFATKPYISSSNYVLKMSDYSSGDWANVWDGLYWRFLDKHQDLLQDNHRMGLILHQLEQMNEDTLKEHKDNAEEFLSEFY